MNYLTRRILISLFVLVYIYSVTTNAVDLAIDSVIASPEDGVIWAKDSNKMPKEATVNLTVKNLVESPGSKADLVLAIDCSGSLGPDKKGQMIGTDPQRQRIDAASQLVDKIRPNDDVGVVLWNETVIGTPLNLTSNKSEIKTYLETSRSSGDTSIWDALAASRSLLETSRPNSKKAIVLFSDGNDTRIPKMNFKGLASDIKQSGIDIYVVGLGKENEKLTDLQGLASPGKYYNVSDSRAIPEIFQTIALEIMGSVRDVKVDYNIPAGLEIFDSSEIVSMTSDANGQEMMSWNVGLMLHNEEKLLSFKVRSERMGRYNLDISATYTKTETDEKGTIRGLKPLNIQVKEESEFLYSGMGRGDTVDQIFNEEHPEYKMIITKSIERPNPKDSGCQDIVITLSTPKIPGKNYVVFALDTSGSTIQSGLNNILLSEIQDGLLGHEDVIYSRIDWDAGPIDANASNWITSGIDYNGTFRRATATNWSIESKEHKLNCSETEGTNYLVGLKYALDKINKFRADPKKMNYFDNVSSSWTIVFITSMSEFDPASISDLSSLKNKTSNVKIYAIGIEMPEDGRATKEIDALKNISGLSYGGDLYLPSNRGEVSNFIDDILTDTSQQSSRVVAENVTVIDSIYPYLRVNENSTNIQPDYLNNNPSDKTTTMKWNLGRMNQSDTKEIRIHTELDLSNLPVDVTAENKKKSSINFTIDDNTETSVVKFTSSLAGKEENKIKVKDLPEGELSIFCGQSCEECQKQSEIQTPILNDSTTTAKEKPLKKNTDAPGFETYLAILGFVASMYLARKG